MADKRIVDALRTWESWFGVAIGVLVGLSPWLAEQTGNHAVMWITVAVGIPVVQFAGLQLVELERSQEVGLMVCGLWLVASPFALDYIDTGTLMYWHFVLGTVVLLLAMLELWQGWKLNDEELVQHRS
jgi:O-antigen/teichoic acid export membrane protein